MPAVDTLALVFGVCHHGSMRSNRLLLATPVLVVATACGSHSVVSRSVAAMAAEAKCQSRFDVKFHVQPRSKAVSEGFVQDLGNGRLRVKGSVPVRADQAHAGSYICDVVPASSGLRIVRFKAKPAT